MTDATDLVARGALKGMVVAISVSDSADLGRLGLSARHCDLAVAEIARSVLLSGGDIAYGGRLVPAGFTQIVMDEVTRFAGDRDALTIYLAASEHASMSSGEIRQFHNEHHASIRLVCLDEAGSPVAPDERDMSEPADPSTALTGMRRHIASAADAHVVVGGQLAGVKGAMPGLLEEALFGLEAEHPVFVAGGFGGAAAAVARALGTDDGHWAPEGYPRHAEMWREPLEQIAALATRQADDGLTDQQRRELAVTHRPADIASLVVLGLARSST
ncbi:hypothetical protein [Nocardioides caricicola]|uniref:DUF2090 domain-containing protein n=1 Tax=Nocardioides caricicola TaxID=634770 RepID=A0ABW0N1T2_9ACTN